MKDIFLLCTTAALFAAGFFMMKKLDLYLERVRHQSDSEIAVRKIYVAIENPQILTTLTPLFESFSKEYPDCEIHIVWNTPSEIFDKLDQYEHYRF